MISNRLLVLGGVLLGAGMLYVFSTGFSKWQASAPTLSLSEKLKPQITTSFYPLYFFAKTIAGEYADVENLTPAGAEPHDYEPTARDMARLEQSNLVVVNGQLESWLPKVQDDLTGNGVTVLVASDGLIDKEYSDEEGARAKDPHIWLSPRLARQIVNRITDALAKLTRAATGQTPQILIAS